MGLDLDGFRQNKEEKEQGNSPFWRPEDGDNVIRILPPTSDFFESDIDFVAIEYYRHYMNVDGRDNDRPRCLRDKDERCPVCTLASKFYDSDDPNLQELARDVYRSSRYLFNILDVNDPEAGVQIYECGHGVWDQITKKVSNRQYGEDIINPRDGVNLTLTRTPPSESKSAQWPEYDVTPHRDNTDATEMLPDGWQSDLDNLESGLPSFRDEDELWELLDEKGLPVEREGGGNAVRDKLASQEEAATASG